MSYYTITYRLMGHVFHVLSRCGELESDVAHLLGLGAASIEVGGLVTY